MFKCLTPADDGYLVLYSNVYLKQMMDIQFQCKKSSLVPLVCPTGDFILKCPSQTENGCLVSLSIVVFSLRLEIICSNVYFKQKTDIQF